MNEPSSEAMISFTVREMLVDIKREIVSGHATTNAKLDLKAEKSDLEHISREIHLVSERTSQLERWRFDQEAEKKVHAERERSLDRRRNWRIAVGGIIGTLALIAATLIPSLVH